MPAMALMCQVIEHSINYWLNQSKSRQDAPASLLGKQLALTLTDIKLTLVFIVNEQGHLYVISNEESADCKIITNLTTLKALEDTSQLTALIKADKLDLQGDIQVAQAFSDWLKGSLTRWQDVLAALIGDIGAYKLSQGVQFAQHAVDNRIQTDRKIIQNALWHEKKLTPSPLEVIAFNDDVMQIRQDYDRLEQRVTQLLSKLNQG